MMEKSMKRSVCVSVTESLRYTADIDTTNMCSHLRHKLMDADGVYHQIWQTLNDDPKLTAVVRSRQLHIYRIL